MLHLLQAVLASGILTPGGDRVSLCREEETQNINNLELPLTACYSVFISRGGL